MSYNEDLILRANWVPLSAVYPYDDNITLSPVLTTWYDGYKTFHHPLYEYSQDAVINKYQEFVLTNEKSLFEFIKTLNSGQRYVLGAYITLSIGGRFATVIDNVLYMDYIFDGILTNNNLFRLIINEDNSVSFLHNGLYVSVQQQLPFDLYLANKYYDDDELRQKFYIQTSEDNSYMYITTKFKNPLFDSIPNSLEYIERFWSYEKKMSSDDDVPLSMRAIGLIGDDDYYNRVTHPELLEYLYPLFDAEHMFENKYVFNVRGLDVYYDASGFNKDYVWVSYYNELLNKEHNIDVDINENFSVSSIKLNNLIDLPYKSKIKLNDIHTGSMEVNIANLKNVLTPEYEVNYTDEVIN